MVENVDTATLKDDAFCRYLLLDALGICRGRYTYEWLFLSLLLSARCMYQVQQYSNLNLIRFAK